MAKCENKIWKKGDYDDLFYGFQMWEQEKAHTKKEFMYVKNEIYLRK